MSLVSFNNYKKKADKSELSDTVISGRYDFQSEDEKRIIPDVINKLDLQPNDSLLDIGCGPGTLLFPLSKVVEMVSGIDNDRVIQRIQNQCNNKKNITTISGNFLEIESSELGLYSKIVIYSVVHYLSSKEELFDFLLKALKLLKPGGRMLIADIPNLDKKSRFEGTTFGKNEIKIWQEKVAKSPIQVDGLKDKDLIKIDDNCYLSILKFARDQGFESYLLPESENLPFGRTRDDILIIAHK
jgi:cyclopropane fatty-acyl-phospholipid synthase-like methyltransferase